MDCVRKAVQFGYGTVVLQSGEDPGVTCPRIAELVERIKAETRLAVTLSLGERDDEELATWRRAGADRYLLRFETSNRSLYERIHPPHPGRRGDRLTILGTLRQLGYEVGSGVMIGIPGQTYEDLADDIELFGRLNLDMIGVGPYLRHPDYAAGRPRFVARCPRRPASAGQRGNDLQGDRFGTAGLPADEHPRYHGISHVEHELWAGVGPGAGGQRRDAEPDAAKIPRFV